MSSPSSTNFVPDSITAQDPTAGWTSPPNSRGTLNILWTCIATIVLCTWTSLTLNVAAIGSDPWSRFQSKFLVFLESIAGPEFIVGAAYGQYLSAWKSVEEFQQLGYSDWTVRHGFFADMGGFVLHAPASSRIINQDEWFPVFPLNVGQIVYLVKHGYIDYKDVHIDLEEIEDKNKFDSVSRSIMVIQLTWFTMNTIARASQKLAITTMELSTIGFVFCTIWVCYFWRHKPKDVCMPKYINLLPHVNPETGEREPGSLERILIDAGPKASLPYTYTPLDFASRKSHRLGLVWSWAATWLAPYLWFLDFHPPKRPVNKLWDDRFEDLSSWGDAFMTAISCVFAAIHIAAWNFYFPTKQERLLWRISTVYILVSMCFALTMMLWMFVWMPACMKWVRSWKQGYQNVEAETVTAVDIEMNVRGRKFRTIEETPPRVSALLLLFSGFVYLLARFLLYVEDIINLRSLPVSAYSTVDWTQFIPHY